MLWPRHQVRSVTLSSGSIVATVVFEDGVSRDYARSLRQDVEDNVMTITVGGTVYTSTAVSGVTAVPNSDAPAPDASTGASKDDTSQYTEGAIVAVVIIMIIGVPGLMAAWAFRQMAAERRALKSLRPSIENPM